MENVWIEATGAGCDRSSVTSPVIHRKFKSNRFLLDSVQQKEMGGVGGGQWRGGVFVVHLSLLSPEDALGSHVDTLVAQPLLSFPFSQPYKHC